MHETRVSLLLLVAVYNNRVLKILLFQNDNCHSRSLFSCSSRSTVKTPVRSQWLKPASRTTFSSKGYQKIPSEKAIYGKFI